MKRTYFIALMLGWGLSSLAGAEPALTEAQPPSLLVDTRCSLSLGGGVIDYGNQSRGQLQAASPGGNTLTPGKRTLTLSVVCPYTQPLRLALRGDRSGNGELRYGERGSVVVRLFDMQRDGESVQIMPVTPDGGVTGSASESQRLQPGQAVGATLNRQLVKGKVFSVRVEIEPIMTNEEARVGVSTTKESLLTLELIN
ncbi:hypothetical protein [Yersinia sp. 2545 StPb PI]|uniref:hypothetical protein n=1 Tax=unclassified Yersinia (in: enterobacteria) TaxID=2653513 RepID=UPI003FA4CB09